MAWMTWLHVCAVTLLAGAGVPAAIGQTSADLSGRPSNQLQSSAVGNPQHGESVAEAKCASCHGAKGNSTDPQYPKLAGQNPAYLYWQLWAFKKGSRSSDVMAGIVATLSDADMANAARFYGQQTRAPNAVQDLRLAAIGERIFFTGMPACVTCHGSRGQRGMMMGRMPMMGMMGRGMMGSGTTRNVPALNGQHAAYVVDQLKHYASGKRQDAMMNRIAAALTESNRRAVAAYLSGLP